MPSDTRRDAVPAGRPILRAARIVPSGMLLVPADP